MVPNRKKNTWNRTDSLILVATLFSAIVWFGLPIYRSIRANFEDRERREELQTYLLNRRREVEGIVSATQGLLATCPNVEPGIEGIEGRSPIVWNLDGGCSLADPSSGDWGHAQFADGKGAVVFFLHHLVPQRIENYYNDGTAPGVAVSFRVAIVTYPERTPVGAFELYASPPFFDMHFRMEGDKPTIPKGDPKTELDQWFKRVTGMSIENALIRDGVYANTLVVAAPVVAAPEPSGLKKQSSNVLRLCGFVATIFALCWIASWLGLDK